MGEVSELIQRADAYAARAGLGTSTVSRKLLGNGVRLDELRRGGSLTVATLERAKQRLSDLEAA
jgi:hypothetical protein